MKYNAKSFIFTLLIILAVQLTLSSCTNSSYKTNGDTEEVLSPTVSPTNTPYNAQTEIKTDIIIDSCYLGRYANGQWSSFLQNSSLNVKKGLSMDLIDLKTHKEYIGYSESEKLGPAIGFLEEEHNMSFKFDREDVMLALNSDFNPLPTRSCLSTDITQNDIGIVQGFLEENGIHDRANINRIIKVDIDNDSKEERIIVANTERNEDFYPMHIKAEDVLQNDAGVYSIVLLVKELDGQDVLIPIFTEIRKGAGLLSENKLYLMSDAYIYIDVIGIYDLNADNRYEIVAKFMDWDRPQIIVYEFKGDKIIPVLYGDLTR